MGAYETGRTENEAPYATMLEETGADFLSGTLSDFHRFFYCGGVPGKRCDAAPCECSSPPCDVCSTGNAESENISPPPAPAPQVRPAARTGNRPCLCLFDVDRTLTGKQEELGHCPRNQQTDVWDTAY